MLLQHSLLRELWVRRAIGISNPPIMVPVVKAGHFRASCSTALIKLKASLFCAS